MITKQDITQSNVLKEISHQIPEDSSLENSEALLQQHETEKTRKQTESIEAIAGIYAWPWFS